MSSGCSRNQRSLSVIVSPPVTPGGPSGATSIVTGGRGGSRSISRATAGPCSWTSPSAQTRILSRSRPPMFPRDATQLVMHSGRAGQDVARQIAGAAVPIGDAPAGFRHQEPACRDVPWSETELEETIEDPTRRPGEIEAGGARPAEILEALERRGKRREIPRKPVLPAEGEPRPDDRPFRWALGHVTRLRGPAGGLPDRPGAALGMPRVAEEWRVDRTRDGNLVFDERHGYPDGGEAVEEVGRAIEWIDDPSKAFGHTA